MSIGEFKKGSKAEKDILYLVLFYYSLLTTPYSLYPLCAGPVHGVSW